MYDWHGLYVLLAFINAQDTQTFMSWAARDLFFGSTFLMFQVDFSESYLKTE